MKENLTKSDLQKLEALNLRKSRLQKLTHIGLKKDGSQLQLSELEILSTQTLGKLIIAIPIFIQNYSSSLTQSELQKISGLGYDMTKRISILLDYRLPNPSKAQKLGKRNIASKELYLKAVTLLGKKPCQSTKHYLEKLVQHGEYIKDKYQSGILTVEKICLELNLSNRTVKKILIDLNLYSPFGNRYTPIYLKEGIRAKSGFREDLQQYFRSGWEANVARILTLLQIEWIYEDKVFTLSNGMRYLPDFYLPQFVYRSKRQNETAKPREDRFISEHGEFSITNSGRRIQGFEKDFQISDSFRVVSIEEYTEPQFVYNLTIEGMPSYLVEDLIVHNCFWAFIGHEDDDDYGAIADKLTQAVPYVIGAGLILTGAFVLSRSNAWKAFINTQTAKTATDFTEATIDAHNAAKAVGLQTEFKTIISNNLDTEI